MMSTWLTSHNDQAVVNQSPGNAAREGVNIVSAYSVQAEVLFNANVSSKSVIYC